MPSPSASGPDEPPGLSSREREILAGIENHLDASAPGLAREMAHPLTAAPPVPAGVVEAGFAILSLFAVLAVAGLVPGVVWAALAIMASMIVVPWVMLWGFGRLERESPGDDTQRDDPGRPDTNR